jgi:hypothetical protein
VDPARAGLIQRVEDEFGISVCDEEARPVGTVGDLHALLVKKLKRDESRLVARALYQIRRALAEELQVPRQSINSDACLAELLPLQERAQRWNRIASRAGGRLPRLRHSRRLQDGIMLTSMALASLPVIALWWALYALDWIRGIGEVLFSMPAVLAFLLVESRVDKHLLSATAHLATELPCETMQELAEAMVELNSRHAAAKATKAVSSEEIWERIADAVRQSGGCEQAVIMPGTALAEWEEVNADGADGRHRSRMAPVLRD